MKRERNIILVFLHLLFLLIIFSCGNLGIPDGGGMIIDHISVDADMIPDSIINDIFDFDIYFEHASVGV